MFHMIKLIIYRFINTDGTKISEKFTDQDNVLPDSISHSPNDKSFKLYKSSMASEELLEKLIAGLSSDIHQKRRVYKNDFTRVINKVKELNFSTKKQGLLLISCCAELLPDESPSCRMDLLEQVWMALK